MAKSISVSRSGEAKSTKAFIFKTKKHRPGTICSA